MSRFWILLWAAALCLALHVYAQDDSRLALKRPDEDCFSPAIQVLSTSVNFFPEEYRIQPSTISPILPADNPDKIQVAQDFEVQYAGTYKIVTNRRANETYVLYQCGTPNPYTLPASSRPANLPANAKAFKIPLVSVSAADSTVIAFLNQLGLFDRVAFASSYAVDPCMQKLKQCGSVSASSWNSTAVAAQAPLVDAVFSSSKSAANNSIAFTATSDPGVLQRAEWFKFLAPFFNQEVEANAMWGNVNDAYNALKDAAQAAALSPRPTVAWLSAITASTSMGYPFNGTYYELHFPAYKTQYIQDAGGQALNRSDLLAAYPGVVLPLPDFWGTGPSNNLMINATDIDGAVGQAALLDILSKVDAIIDETYYPATSGAPNLAAFLAAFGLNSSSNSSSPALTNKAVYTLGGTLSSTGSTDWFETAVARPDLVLVDFVSAINPDTFNTTNITQTQRRWLYRLDSSDQVVNLVAANCQKLPNCDSRSSAIPICPATFRNCTTGQLMHASPVDRCKAYTSCPVAIDDATEDTNTSSTPAPPKNGATGAASSRAALLAGAAGALLSLAALL